MKKNFILAGILVFLSGIVYSQSPDILKIRKYRIEHEKPIMDEFVSFLSIPNVAIDTINLHKSAEFLMEMMKKRGIQQVQLLKPVSAGEAGRNSRKSGGAR